MLKLAVLGVRGFLLLFGAVVLGLSVTLAKQQVEGSPPAETSFGSFCGAFGILVSLIGIAALFIDKIPSIVSMGADGVATALYLAGAIVRQPAISDGIYTKNGLKWSRAVRMNQIQVIGTHNSYHRESPLEAREAQAQLLESVINYYYSHAALDVQASYQSVRSFELDIFADPEGGKYATPLVIRNSGTELPPQDVMNKPGVKVLHVSDADVWPSCYTLIECLTIVKKWSQEHPNHVPIPFMLEFKTAETGTGGGAPLIPWNDSELLDDLDEEIRSVFSPSQLITADDLRRDNHTLEQSVLKYEWPDLDSARGRVFFLMDNEPGSIRDVYTTGRPNLEGRVIFTNSKPGYDDCVFQKLNDPRNATSLEYIQRQVHAGYWVRTRADEPLTTILSNDTTSMRDSAFDSGAQIVSTDFPTYGLTSRWHVDYSARFKGGIAVRCNPISGKDSCVNALLEPEEYLRD
ncbi:putative acid phosphatase protein [Daldinia childiae]|uniref:putative acid phosphatase protein n=1 Tax=Daldinia childiae TaxID=326645 RepID=UPI001446C497|nr:putative acid phosphatase protein [Daldinia childiae]KAF3059248.1 putative acid phosphatase protein [Daldinia childiae]